MNLPEKRQIIRQGGSNIDVLLIGSLEDNANPTEESTRRLVDAVPRYGSELPECYKGGTSSPTWRWNGGASDRKTPMAGHHTVYQYMRVVAARKGPAGPALEKDLIKMAVENFPDQTLNRAPDARGLGKSGWNFIYICQP